MHFHADEGWDTFMKDAIGNLSALIKQFADILKALVASFKKVPAAANGDSTVEEPDYD